MITVLIHFVGRPSRKITTPLTRQEVEGIVQMFDASPEINCRWATSAETSPVMITGAGGDADIEEFFVEALSNAGSAASALNDDTNLPMPDPRTVDLIDPNGDGIRSLPTGDGRWQVEAFADHRPIYSVSLSTRQETETSIELLCSQIATLNSVQQYLSSVAADFPDAPYSSTDEPEEVIEPLPDLTVPLDKKTTCDRLEKLMGKNTPSQVAPAPMPEIKRPGGTFLFLREGAAVPLQIIMKGDGEQLKDIGFLDQLKKKFPRDVELTGVEGTIRTVKIRKHAAKKYLEMIRAILLDCSLVQEYEIESAEYVPSEIGKAPRFFL